MKSADQRLGNHRVGDGSRHLSIVAEVPEQNSVGYHVKDRSLSAIKPFLALSETFAQERSYRCSRQTSALQGVSVPRHGVQRELEQGAYPVRYNHSLGQEQALNTFTGLETTTPNSQRLISCGAPANDETTQSHSRVKTSSSLQDVTCTSDDHAQAFSQSNIPQIVQNQHSFRTRLHMNSCRNPSNHYNMYSNSMQPAPYDYRSQSAQSTSAWSYPPLDPWVSQESANAASAMSISIINATIGPRQGRRRQAQDCTNVANILDTVSSPVGSSKYYCTFQDCPGRFDELRKWKRHERDTHAPVSIYICNLTEPSQLNGLACQVCNIDVVGLCCPHRIPKCIRGGTYSRAFPRKECLQRHLKQQHRLPPGESKHIANRSRIENVLGDRELTCFFCWAKHDNWKSRANHVGAHIEDGETKVQWNANVASIFG